MAKTRCKAAARRMRREYGDYSCEICFACCNRQKKNREEQTKVCIAFSNDVPWDGAESACGLFNIPFRGIRPKRLPLNDVINKAKTSRLTGAACENQDSFFLPLA